MARKQVESAFRAGRSGACEAKLYTFTGRSRASGAQDQEMLRVAATKIEEAVIYVRTWHEDFDITRVEMISIIEVISGSPLN